MGSGVPSSINEIVAAVGKALSKELTPLHVTAESGGVSLVRKRSDGNYGLIQT